MLSSGLGESLPVTFQSLQKFFILYALQFYYEWRVALFFLGTWPFAIILGLFLQKVLTNTCYKIVVCMVE